MESKFKEKLLNLVKEINSSNNYENEKIFNINIHESYDNLSLVLDFELTTLESIKVFAINGISDETYRRLYDNLISKIIFYLKKISDGK